ncbi:flagellar basal body rod protein FlgB [Planctomycetes bacterium K23_9]
MTGIFSQLNSLNHALQGTQENHRVLSQNIANYNTPGYKTQRLDFDQLMSQLQAAGKSPDEAAKLIAQAPVEEAQGLAERVDGNNVDLEREVSELKKNALTSQAYTQLMASKLAMMRRAIS